MSLVHTLRFIANHPLNAGRKPQALLRFARWQIASRVSPGQIVFEWINGTRMIVRPGETGFTQNIYCGLHEFSDMAYVLHALTADDFFVDIGANVGSYTILACAARGARGYCIEPVPTTYRRLVDNVRLNDLTSRVVSLNIGVSKSDGDLFFTTGENCTNHVIPAGASVEGATRIRVQTLDRILENNSPNLIKIDVEGFESQVIEGARDTLANPSLHSIILELNGNGSRYGFKDAEIVASLESSGFAPYSYNPFARELSPIAGKNGRSGNTLFIRNLDFVRERLANTPRVRIGAVNL